MAVGSGKSVARRSGCPAGQPLAPEDTAHPVRQFETPDGALDLEGFLKELNDDKLRQLREGVQREARRRGRVETLAAGASPAAVAKELGIGRTQVARLARTMKTVRPARS